MSKKPEPPPDDGRRCYACNGPSRPLVKYALVERRDAGLRAMLGVPAPVRIVDMHPVCVGTWLTGNEGQRHALAFAQGELGKDGQLLHQNPSDATVDLRGRVAEGLAAPPGTPANQDALWGELRRMQADAPAPAAGPQGEIFNKG
jgi:hypothetical protein